MNQASLSPHFSTNLPARQRKGKFWLLIFRLTTLLSVLFLLMLLFNIINQAFGYVAIETRVDPASLVADERSLDQLEKDELTNLLEENLSAGRITQLNREKAISERSWDDLYDLVYLEVLQPGVLQSWKLVESLTESKRIRSDVATDYPQATLVFQSWLDPDLIHDPQSSKPLEAGVRTALLGSIWTIIVTILVAFPLGVGAAIYLEEYAVENRLNRIIQTNINNLAGVPSIIYGMLGLAIFVRTLAPLTSGQIFGMGDGSAMNGRTILSAGLTLALLVLPLIIINTQEAIKAVPDSLRHASYGVGATQWQTIWHHVLPSALPGILTGIILAISRAIGETAPLVVVGAATYITFDPSGLFSKFTTLPIQIYQWSSRPQAEFQHLASAAILVLLIMLLTLNSIAIVLRNRYKAA
jgi:phosphate transport system permease protein